MAVLQRDISGQSTQILLQSFADRSFVLITQVGKVGNLIQATIPSTTPSSSAASPDDNDSLPQPSPAIQLTPLLGSSPSDHHHTLHSLYASQIATIIWECPSHGGFDESRTSVVVGLALRKVAGAGIGCELGEEERTTFRGVMKMLQDMLNGNEP